MKKIAVRLHRALQVHSPGGGPINLQLDDGATFPDLPPRLGLAPGEVALYVVGSYSVSPDTVILGGSTVDLYPLYDATMGNRALHVGGDRYSSVRFNLVLPWGKYIVPAKRPVDGKAVYGGDPLALDQNPHALDLRDLRVHGPSTNSCVLL